MTGRLVRGLALNLIDTDLEGKRATSGYRRAVRRDVTRFFNWMDSQNIECLEAVGKAELTGYYQHLCSQRSTAGTRIGELLSGAYIHGIFKAAANVFTTLYRFGYLASNPFHGLDVGQPPGRGMERRPFTEAEMAEFLEQLDPSTPLGLRDRALFELIYSSGLRAGEAARLTIGDVDLEKREIVVHGKGSRDRLIPVSVVARDFLMLYIGERITRCTEAVFLGTHGKGIGKPLRPKEVTRRFHTLLVKCGMDGRGRCTHAVRHSTATHLLDHGANIRHIQELLGHKNIDTTVRYTQVQTAGLQKIYRKYHPGEHELFEAVDDEYLKRLENLIAGKGLT